MAKALDQQDERVRENLERFRKWLGLTQPEVADEADLPLDTLRRYESGRSTIDHKDLRRLAICFGRRIEEFFEKDPTPAAPRSQKPVYYLKMRRGARHDEARRERLLELIAQANAEELHEPGDPTSPESPAKGGGRRQQSTKEKPMRRGRNR